MLRQFSRRLMPFGAVVALCCVSRFVLSAPGDSSNPALAPPELSAANTATSDAPQAVASPNQAPAAMTEQSYIGTNQCFVCHRPQANAWSETHHARAFTDLPEKYRNDAACLKCHVTGFGAPRGYVAGTDKDLLMVGCESCHGPGARHVDAAQRFVMATTDEAKIEEEMRESITKTPTDSVCAACHKTQAHGRHPPYEGGQPAQAASGSAIQRYPGLPVAGRSTSTLAPAHYSSGYSVKTCGSCHYDEYKQSRGEKHSALSTILPAKYGSDQDCRKCHLETDAATGSPTVGADPHHNQVGTVCESCHGPALEHVRFNVQFIHLPPLGPELEQAARNAIRKGKPANACIQCHVRQSHQQHPQFDEK